ncbi:MAG: fibronectin type III domain-containing protein [bacterium]
MSTRPHKLRPVVYVRRRRSGTSTFASGLVYVVAVVAVVAIGAFFYGSYEKAKRAPRSYSQADLPFGMKRSAPGSAAADADSTANRNLPKAPQAAAPAQHPTTTSATSAAASPIAVAVHSASGAMPAIQAEPRVPWVVLPEEITNPQKGKMEPLADTVAIATVKGQDWNGGGLKELPLRGDDAVLLARFDIRSVVGWTVTKASWHCKVTKGNLRTLSFSTVPVDREEGSGTFDGPAANGATYAYANAEKVPWTPDHAPLAALLRGNSGSLVSYSEPDNPDNRAGDWVVYDLRTALVQAMISGTAGSLAICDEKGQRALESTIASREDESFSHYIEVEGQAVDRTPPSQIEAFKAFAHTDLRGARTSGALLTWLAPGDDEMQGQAFRYDAWYASTDVPLDQATPVARETIPTPILAGRVEQLVVQGLNPDTEYTFFIRAADEAGQLGPVSTTKAITAPPLDIIEAEPPNLYDGLPVDVVPGQLSVEALDLMMPTDSLSGNDDATAARTSIIWDRASRSIHLRAARNQSVEVLLQFSLKTGTFPPVHIEVLPFIAPDGKPMDLKSRLYEVVYAAAGGSRTNLRWVGDALIPLKGVLDPAKSAFPVPGRKYQSVLADITVPKDAPSGLYRCKIKLSVASQPDVNLNVFLTVEEVVLGEPAFTVELAEGPYAIAQVCKKDPLKAAEARAVERDYQRLAVEHRAHLVLIPYTGMGECPVPYAPQARGSGAEWSIASWQEWDDRFADYLAGPHVILPLFEDWPTPFLDGYSCADQEILPPGRTTKVYAGMSRGIPECLSRDYWETLGAAASAFGAHFKEMDHQRIEAHVWLTSEPSTGYIGRLPPWNLAHPSNRDDFLALKAYGEKGLSRVADAWGASQFVFRVSVPNLRALCDYGAGVFNLLAVEDVDFSHWPLLKNRLALTHERVWLQTAGLSADAGAAGLASLALNAFLNGADGWTVRGVVGQADDWKTIDDAAVIHTGAALGETAPYPSLRLKVLRSIQQDLDLLMSLQERQRWNRDQLRDFAAGYMTEENGTYLVTTESLRRLRYATLEWLAK